MGVKTTGIFCRPICPAKPLRKNVEFFNTGIEAEAAGYRPCLRCRPESAPKSPAWIGKSAVVRRAIRMLQNGIFATLNEEKFAEPLGVSARHLRRLFIEEIGKTPKQLWIENRLSLARTLIVETDLALSEIAFASGFNSIRRFNDSFKDRFSKKPSEIRRNPLTHSDALRVSIPYRPPFDFEGLLGFYFSHRMGSLEHFTTDSMTRVVSWDQKVGTLRISHDPAESRLLVDFHIPDTSKIHSLVSQVRALFDTDSDPLIIANSIELDPELKVLLSEYPGIRLPSGWEPFEVAISAILGQLVSVDQGRSLVNSLIELLGREVEAPNLGRVKLFPSAEILAGADLSSLKTTLARKKTVVEFSRAIVEKRLTLEPTQDVQEFLKQAQLISGIGPWTANYIAMKALRLTDAFPETDLILARALEIHGAGVIEQTRPWRGYVAALFWRKYSVQLKKTRKKI